MNILCILFFEFFKIALFTIGGGLAMIPVIEDTFVKKRHLLNETDIMDMVGITQTVPGLIAVNSAVFVGHKLAGWWGSFVAAVGVVLPSVIIIAIIAATFPLENLSDLHALKSFQCVRACVLGLFLTMAFKMGQKLLKSVKDTLLLLILVGILFFGVGSVAVVLSACILGGLYETYIRTNQRKDKE